MLGVATGTLALIGSLAAAGAAVADHAGIAHPPGDPSRSYELVSPAYKLSGAGVGLPEAGGIPYEAADSGTAAYVGERFAVVGHLGNMLLDAPFATASDWALAERAGDELGWRSHSPVTRAFKAAENYRMMFMQEAAPDLSTIMWVANSGDLPFFEEMGPLGVANDGSSLVSDWGSPPESPTRWEPIAPLEVSHRVTQNLGDTAQKVFLTPVVSADGSTIAASGAIRGLAGDRDPTLDTAHPTAHSAYNDDISAGLSDSWPGDGVRTPTAQCTGADGSPTMQARTQIPVRQADGALVASACAEPDPSRDARLVSDFGSGIAWQTGQSSAVGTSATNVVSRDGSRTFFMAPDPALGLFSGYPGVTDCVGDGTATKCPTQLYLRQRNTDGELVTRWLSRPPALDGGPIPAALLGPAYFEGASADGSKVFFRTNSPLTADDPNGATQTPANSNPATTRGARSWDLYMFELAPGPDGDPSTPDGDPTGPGSTLTRITAGPTGDADCSTQPDVSAANALRLVSQDGDRVYFSCAAPLGGAIADRATGTAAGTQGGTPATSDQTNVYLYDASVADPASRYRFIARLPRTTGSGTFTNQNLTRCASAAGMRGASVLQDPIKFGASGRGVTCWRGSDDGGWVSFWTLGRLTADDPHEFGPGASADIYAYDAVADELVRVSAPQGGVDDAYPCGNPEAGTLCYADPGMHTAGNEQNAPNPLLNVVSDPGGPRVLFFESAGRLVDGDQNSVFDVYQWRDGVLSLVSSGAPDSDGATYKGNSKDGLNVYLATKDKLSWQDVDEVLDIYTARVDGGIIEPVVPSVCSVLGDACQAVGAGSAVGSSLVSATPVAGERLAGVRRRLAIGRVGSQARRRATRSGVLAVRVRVSRPGVVRLSARARIGRRSIGVGGARKRLAKPGSAVVRLRLSDRARSALGRGRALRVALRAVQTGARSRTATVVLKRSFR